VTAEPSATEKLQALRDRTAQSSNAGTVSAISTTGHVASAGIFAAGAYSAYSSGGMTALRCFGGRVAAPIAGAMAGAWIAEQVHADEAALWVAEQFGAQRLAGPGQRVAHLGHMIAHSNAFMGLLAGIAAGIVVGAAVALAAAAVIGTAGMAAPLVGAAVAFGAGAAGGFVTAAIAGAGAKSATISGPIASGSLNVFFEGRPVARVTDMAACTKHPSVPSLIIEGSKTIAINGLPMARIGHKLSCNAVVQEGCDTIFGDDTTGSYGTPDAEFSIAQQLLLSAAEVLGMRSAVRQGGLLDGSLRRLFGEPVDVVTGDYADERVDFEYPGILPLRLGRVYPGRMRVEGVLGSRWICNWSQRLVIDEQRGTALLEDAGGQRLVFALGSAEHIDATHLKAPYYRLTGTRKRPRLFDSRTQQFLVFAPVADGSARLEAIEDRNGNRIDFLYDAAGHLCTVRHADGATFHVDTTREGWLRSVSIAGEGSPLVQYDYDAAGNLLRASGAFSGEFHYTYTPEGWLAAWRDSGATRVELAYDGAGRVVGTRTADGMFDDRFLYFPEQRLSRYVDATGAVRNFWYDANNLVTTEEDPLGQRTIQVWDDLERLQERIDPAGRVTRFAYDGDGRRIGEEDWAGRKTAWTYDRWGALLAVATPDGGESAWKYDARGNVVAWSQSDGASGDFVYDDRGAVVRESVKGMGAVAWERDRAGRPLVRRDAAGRTTRYEWDHFGRLTATADPVGRTTAFAYDREVANPRGAVSRVVRPDGGEIRFSYDAAGLIASRERGDGQTTRFVHGAFDTLRRVVDPLGAVTEFAYDGAGRLAGVVNAAGQAWRFRYDAAGQLAAQSDWAGRETLYRRDALGRVVAKRLPDGAEQLFEWDERDRIARVVAGEDAISYRYDTADRLVGASTHRRIDGKMHALSDLTLSYDGQGRLIGEEQNGVVISYRYDAAGRCVGRSSPSGETALTFDEAGLMNRYESNGHRLRFVHDASGLETLREASTLGARTAFQLRQSYDPCGQLQDQRAGSVPAFAASAREPDKAAFSRRYDWDKVGRLVGVVDGAGAAARYRYDARDQGVAVDLPGEGETYRYDALMNLAASLAGEHRYWRDCVVEAGPNRFQYDARGRMVERVATTAGFRPQRWRYHWDGFDHLVGLDTPDGQHWRYVYDAFGRRVRKQCRGAAENRRVDYVWQGEALVEAWERRDGEDGGALSVERWHFEPGSFRPLAKEAMHVEGAQLDTAAIGSEWLPIVADQIGTPRAMFRADGEQCWQAENTLWGRARAARNLGAGKGAGEACALRFQGQWEDAESGLHYNLNRYYDPDTGQYLSSDPIGLDGGLRTHGYVHDPLSRIDPYGLADAPGTVTYPVHPTLTPQPGSYSTGISRAWAQERALVQETGRGTVNWTPAQQAELIKDGRVRGFTGHHINNAATQPAWEGDPRNIRFLANGRVGLPNDHLYSDQGHRGSWQNSTKGRLIDRVEMLKRFRAGCV